MVFMESFVTLGPPLSISSRALLPRCTLLTPWRISSIVLLESLFLVLCISYTVRLILSWSKYREYRRKVVIIAQEARRHRSPWRVLSKRRQK